MATIKNIGIKCDSRAQARTLAKTLPNGKVVDMCQRYDNPVARWIVLHDKVLTLCSGTESVTRRVFSYANQAKMLRSGKKVAVVMNKRTAQKWSMLPRKAA